MKLDAVSSAFSLGVAMPDMAKGVPAFDAMFDQARNEGPAFLVQEQSDGTYKVLDEDQVAHQELEKREALVFEGTLFQGTLLQGDLLGFGWDQAPVHVVRTLRAFFGTVQPVAADGPLPMVVRFSREGDRVVIDVRLQSGVLLDSARRNQEGLQRQLSETLGRVVTVRFLAHDMPFSLSESPGSGASHQEKQQQKKSHVVEEREEEDAS